MRPRSRARRSSSDGPIDLRSDTVTRPTKRMREAMAAAEVDDDVLGGDPTMRELEARVAGLLGTDDALWTPSGSMANLIALMSHLHRGDAFLAPAGAHVLDAELGTAAWLAGGMPRPLPHDAGPGKISPGRRPPRGGQRRARTTRCAPRCCAWRTPTTPRAAPSRPLTSTPPSPPRPARREPARAPRRRAALARRGRARRPAGDADGGRRHRPGLLQQGARRPGRLRGGRVRRVRRTRPGGCARCSAAASGRAGCSPRRRWSALDRMERLADDHAKAPDAGRRVCASGAGPSATPQTNIVLIPVADLDGTLRRFADAGVLRQQHGRQGPADAARRRRPRPTSQRRWTGSGRWTLRRRSSGWD